MRIGTRKSALALEQAHQVQDALTARGIESELVPFTTLGDRRLDASFLEIGAKGLFTKELEVALAEGTIDCAVHSFKDLPTDTTGVVAVLPRADPRDVVVGSAIADLPPGARVGTSSLRRRAQLRAIRPDLELVEFRGNVPTRLRKVAEGQVRSAILAAAGLIRLGATQHITAYLDPPDWLPAPGQGAIAIQARVGGDAAKVLAPLNDAETMRDVTAERSMLAALDGGCQVPIGGLVLRGVLHGLIADVDGARVVRGSEPVDPANPAAAGLALAAKLREWTRS
ncbi:MAG TPA: hydroxymethylbilane synthase [Gemmatimonadaceae bacterium]|jgi:hydroxymethylbilane synthase|nr:hydroxymethylbilane synthase [Gemmatimonadaceae bacterium]